MPSPNVNLFSNRLHMTYTTRILNMNERCKCQVQKQGTEQYLLSLYS